MVHGLLVISAILAVSSCTDAGLQPMPQEIQTYDDKLQISGEFCTNPADEVSFPVKLLIVMDQSASLQCTDPNNARLDALNRAGSELDALPNVEFGVVGFASWSNITEFSNRWGDASAALSLDEGSDGPATDYQGALSTVLRVLEQDMIDAGPAEVARSKYIILFLSDGIPEPRCNAGCDDDDDLLYGVCNTSEEIPDDVYVDMYSECPEYNQSPQIMQKVQDIISLGDTYGAGEMKLHSIFLFAPENIVTAQCGDVAEQFGYVREEAEPLLRKMADEGMGTFRDVNTTEEIDFLDFDYESLQARYDMKEFFAINMNVVPGETGVLIDSDGDGLGDDEEFEAGLTRLSQDSDGDHFSDLLEYRYAKKGFDPKDPEIPSIGCSLTNDSDGDGLRDCEERFLKTDELLVDSDGDRIPDGVEFRLGLNPTEADTSRDHDFDNARSGEEVRVGTNPLVLDEEGMLVNKIIYSVNPGNVGPQETQCYNFEIQNLTLVPTMNLPDERGKKGTNRIYIYAGEEPMNSAGTRGRYHVACVEARYLGETYKNPASGMIRNLPAERFVDLELFDPERHCLEAGADPNAMPDGGMP
jgi:hypothetical protein